jgi:hypothetical protein
VGSTLLPGTTYTFAVRARDPHGALSPWSATETFTLASTDPVTVNGTPASNLRSAVAGAQPGDLILLGAGTYPLSETLRVGGGVVLQGAGTGKTKIDATGLSVGISFETADPKAARLDQATVSGAETCVSVAAGVTGVQLTHLVARDCATAGIAVRAGGGAVIVNATLVGDGIGVDSAGSATLKNSLLTGNTVALKSDTAGALSSSYDDLFGNQAAYAGLAAGTGDLSTAVAFVDLAGRNLALAGPQPSTDMGDPADDVGAEPKPNGDRINLGAFGGTADAELSVSSIVGGNSPPSPTPTSGPGGQPTPNDPTPEAGGCATAGRSPHGDATWVASLLTALVFARRRSRGRAR